MTTYKIHPAIGVARVGTSQDFYIGPERSGALPSNPDGRPFTSADFRDRAGHLRRQAARFTIWRYDAATPEGVQVSLGEHDIASITWTVHIANKKASWYQFQTNEGEYGYSPEHPLRNPGLTGQARQQLIIDPGPRTLSRPGQHAACSRATIPAGYPGRFPPHNLQPRAIETLGDAHMQADGSLVVAGGHGHAGSTIHPAVITEYANNDGWFDDTSDGSIQATLTLTDGSTIEATHAWFLCGPPAYAPEILNMVTLHDTMFDAMVRNFGVRPDIYANTLWNDGYRPSFANDIHPILARALAYKWVVAIPPHPHVMDFARLGDPDPAYNGLRQYYLDHMRSPDQGNQRVGSSGAPMMPWLAGDNALNAGYLTSNYLTFTRTQYFMLSQWAAGKFEADAPQPAPAGGAAIDQGVLENCVGGAFSPGIEMTWISREPRIYAAPYRIKRRALTADQQLSLGLDFDAGLEPGDVTRYMAVPWQADFNECSSQPIGDRWYWWWPAQRPLHVRDEATPHLLVGWAGTIEDQNAGDYLQFAEDIDMVTHWQNQGFIMNVREPGEAPQFVQVAKRPPK